MRRIVMALALFMAWSAMAASPVIVIENVTVIDGTDRPPAAGMTVIIRGDRIQQIGRADRVRIPRGAEVIPGAGRFLIPGLWDMHVHLGDGDFDRASLALFVANGVTGIRIMDGAPQHHQWRGDEGAPRMIIGSEIIGFAPTDEAEAVRAARAAKRGGAEFLKVHDNVTRAAYLALVRESRALHLPLAGHVPVAVTVEEAARLGQKSIEHLTGLASAVNDPAAASSAIALFLRYGTFHCPTLMMRRNYARLDDPELARDPRLAYVKPSWRARWAKMSEEAQAWPAGEGAKRRATIEREFALVARMARAGVPILAGTDDGNPYSLLGFGLHDELVALVDAGLTPLQALQTATRNAARYRGELRTSGTIERGKVADLVLLNANPLEDIRNTRAIETVILGGKVHRRGELVVDQPDLLRPFASGTEVEFSGHEESGQSRIRRCESRAPLDRAVRRTRRSRAGRRDDR